MGQLVACIVIKDIIAHWEFLMIVQLGNIKMKPAKASASHVHRENIHYIVLHLVRSVFGVTIAPKANNMLARVENTMIWYHNRILLLVNYARMGRIQIHMDLKVVLFVQEDRIALLHRV